MEGQKGSKPSPGAVMLPPADEQVAFGDQNDSSSILPESLQEVLCLRIGLDSCYPVGWKFIEPVLSVRGQNVVIAPIPGLNAAVPDGSPAGADQR